jgi:hypothetical protein
VYLRWDKFSVHLSAFPIPLYNIRKERRKKERKEKKPNCERNTESQQQQQQQQRKSKHDVVRGQAYHELQMSDMTFDAHSAFVAPNRQRCL